MADTGVVHWDGDWDKVARARRLTRWGLNTILRGQIFYDELDDVAPLCAGAGRPALRNAAQGVGGRRTQRAAVVSCC